MTDAPRTLLQRIAELERLVAESPQAPYVWMHRFANAAPAILARVRELEQALRSAVKIADEASEEWDKAPNGMRAGKILIALSGRCPGYRADIDSIHAALKPGDQHGCEPGRSRFIRPGADQG